MTSTRSYAVSWREDEGPLCTGRLRLTPRSVQLEGRAGDAREALRSLAYREIDGLSTERPNGYRNLVVRLRGGARVAINTLDRPGSLTELRDELRRRAPREEA